MKFLLRSLSPVMAVSTGSACSSSKPSHVLAAIGLTIDEVRNTIRFSLSHLIKVKDLDIIKSFKKRSNSQNIFRLLLLFLYTYWSCLA